MHYLFLSNCSSYQTPFVYFLLVSKAFDQLFQPQALSNQLCMNWDQFLRTTWHHFTFCPLCTSLTWCSEDTGMKHLRYALCPHTCNSVVRRKLISHSAKLWQWETEPVWMNCSMKQLFICPLERGIIKAGFPRWLSGKEPTCKCCSQGRCRLHLWVRKIWRRKWQLATVLLSG